MRSGSPAATLPLVFILILFCSPLFMFSNNSGHVSCDLYPQAVTNDGKMTGCVQFNRTKSISPVGGNPLGNLFRSTRMSYLLHSFRHIQYAPCSRLGRLLELLARELHRCMGIRWVEQCPVIGSCAAIAIVHAQSLGRPRV